MTQLGINRTKLPDYAKVHMWLKKEYKKPNTCQLCKREHKRIEWALIKGMEYEKKRENFIPLCVRCHRNYDVTDYMRERSGRRGVIKINPITLEESGYPSVKEASRKSGVTRTGIQNCLSPSNVAKTSGGYIWKYKN